jgi:DhnA family fructose-bisphosphate aldolase class Ia
MNELLRRKLTETRLRHPEAIGAAARERVRRPIVRDDRRLLVIAADHTARGVVDIAQDDAAMGNRYDLLERLLAALALPQVDGVLATPDIVEDLLVLGALDDKVVFGSMNRGGHPLTAFEMDDRFTAYSPEAIAASSLDGGKMLVRIDPDDPASVRTLEACSNAVTQLAAHRLVALLEPFIVHRVDGHARHDLSAGAIVRSMAIAAALGSTSAYTWLKIPVVTDMERVVEAATTPLMLLGGARSDKPDELFAKWEKTLKLPGVVGLAVGRNLLYPPDGDVESAVAAAASLL